MATPRVAAVVSGLIAACLLAGCAGNDTDDGEPRSDASGLSELPVPEGGRGGVTGMPALPGPGTIGAPGPTPDLQPEPLVDGEGNPIETAADSESADGLAGDLAGNSADSGAPAFPGEPGVQDAVAVVREYYAAIDRSNFAHAYRLWSDGGVAAGQSPQQFADSFAATAAHSVEFMTPGRIDAAAGARYVEIPVAIEATGRDGAVKRFAGAYTLRRTVADGASAEQRAWRIVSADLREVRP